MSLTFTFNQHAWIISNLDEKRETPPQGELLDLLTENWYRHTTGKEEGIAILTLNEPPVSFVLHSSKHLGPQASLPTDAGCWEVVLVESNANLECLGKMNEIEERASTMMELEALLSEKEKPESYIGDPK